MFRLLHQFGNFIIQRFTEFKEYDYAGEIAYSMTGYLFELSINRYVAPSYLLLLLLLLLLFLIVFVRVVHQ
jgi:hypothetical protein